MAGRGSGGRRDDILAVFIRHVAERGYDRTNLGDIADELHLSKGTIVHHFGAKAQMLRELEETYMQRQLEKLRLLWDALPAPPERVAALIYAAALLQVSDRDATVATQREVAQLAGEPEMLQVRKLRSELQDVLRSELRRGVELGVFRPIDPDLATLLIFGASQWMWTWFDPDGSRTPEQVGAAFVDVFVGGLLAAENGIGRLADPDGEVPRIVRTTLRER